MTPGVGVPQKQTNQSSGSRRACQGALITPPDMACEDSSLKELVVRSGALDAFCADFNMSSLGEHATCMESLSGSPKKGSTGRWRGLKRILQNTSETLDSPSTAQKRHHKTQTPLQDTQARIHLSVPPKHLTQTLKCLHRPPLAVCSVKEL